MLAGVVAQAGAQVTLRSGDGTSAATGKVEGAVVAAGPSGLVVEASGGGTGKARRLVGWDRVHAVKDPQAGLAAPYMAFADGLWRARTRLERGDWLAASTLLRELRPRVDEARGDKSGAGPTGAVFDECLLRCELARGARAGALAAWFDWMQTMDRAGALNAPTVSRPASWVGGVVDGPGVIHSRTGLIPALPPIWVGESAIDTAVSLASGVGGGGAWDRQMEAGGIKSAEGRADEISCAIVDLYTAAAKFEIGERPSVPGAAGVGGAGGPAEGVRLVRLIVLARVGTADQREVGRAGLRTMAGVDGVEPWIEAWSRAGIGRSLLVEPDAQQRIRGILELLHVPARFSRVCPDLAAVALAESAVALWELDDRDGAVRVRDELVQRFPASVAAGWERLSIIKEGAIKPRPAPEQLPTDVGRSADRAAAPRDGLEGGRP